MTDDPRARYRGSDTSCRVQGCSAQATVVVGTKVEFGEGAAHTRERVNVSLALCRGHSADLLTAMRDGAVGVRRRSLSERNVRAFEPFTKGGGE